MKYYDIAPVNSLISFVNLTRLTFVLFQSSSTDPYCFVEFETKKAAEYALAAMHNRNVYDKVSDAPLEQLT